jgi:CRISPR/Cas system CMR subunit Cmr4 (Cas7 group RAMP superfamily)
MTCDYSYTKRSQSVTSESEDNAPVYASKGSRSDLGAPRAKPIKKPKFLTRKQVMYRYMERVEKINNKLLEMKKNKQKQRMQSQMHSQKKAIVENIKIKVVTENSKEVTNVSILNTSRSGQHQMLKLLSNFAAAI